MLHRLSKSLLASPALAGLSCSPEPCARTYTQTWSLASDAGTLADGGAASCADLCIQSTCPIFGPLLDCGFETVDGGPGYYCNWRDTSGCGDPPVCVGRRPPGLLHAQGHAASYSTAGDYFAAAARLEAASVDAFQLLAMELAKHGAPSQLTRRAMDAAREEVRHALIMAALAEQHGTAPLDARVVPLRQCRSLLEVALENVSEGCVRELYGAHVGMHQAVHAADPMARAALRIIAEDEVSHGELSWQVHGWVIAKLAPSGRRAVNRRLGAAVEQLRAEAGRQPTQQMEAVGLPPVPVALALVDRLWRDYWN